MPYVIQVRIQYERPRYLTWDPAQGWDTTQQSKAMTFSTSEEGAQVAQDESVKNCFKACHLKVVPLKV